MNRKCKTCGCTESDKCYNIPHGVCWWLEDDLCSHCIEIPGEAIRLSELDFKTRGLTLKEAFAKAMKERAKKINDPEEILP